MNRLLHSLADLSLERVPGDDASLLAMAGFFWITALVVMFRQARGGLLKPAQSRPLPSGTHVLQFAAGVGAVLLLTEASTRTEKARLPEGWSIIRPPQEVSALIVQGATVWAGGRAGLYAVDRVSGATRRHGHFQAVRDLALDADGALWIAHAAGVSKLDGAPIVDGSAYAVTNTRNGTLWIGTEHGLYSYRTGTLRKVADYPVSFVFEDSRGALWFGSDDPSRGGLWRWQDSRWTAFTNSLVHPSVNGIAEAADGSMWLAAGFGNGGGLMSYAHGAWSSKTKKDGLPGDKMRSAFRDSRGAMWFGSEYDGILTGGKVLTPADGLAGFEVKEMVEDSDGVLWLGTEAGLSRIRGRVPR